MSTKTLILMVGLPRSGKSSEARQMGHPIVNRDSIRKTLGVTVWNPHHPDFDWRKEKYITDLERIMAESLFRAGHDNVIIDSCNLRLNYRNAWKKWADEREYKVYLFHVMTSLETCIMRAKRTRPDQPDFPEFIKFMWKKSNIDLGKIPEKQRDYWN